MDAMDRSARPVLDAQAFAAPPDVARWQTRALVVGAVATVACLAGAFANPQQFFRSYLIAWLLWLGVCLGSLLLLMIHHLSGGGWGLMIRRVLEAATRTLPLLVLFFVPLALSLPSVYPWAKPGAAAADELIAKKQAYLNAPFFITRSLLYFLVLGILIYLLNRWSRRQDETGDPTLFGRMKAASGAGMVIFILFGTFTAVDWVMSLDAHWYSSVFSLIFMTGQGLSALAFAIVVAHLLASRAPLAGLLGKKHFHDYGKLLLAFVMFWTYLAISQFIISWQANLPEEVIWFQHRLRGGWQWIGGLLIVLHFFFPFLLLLSRSLKKRTAALAGVALLLFAMRWVDLVWHVGPTYSPEVLRLHWLDVAAPIAVGGLWLAAFFRELRKRPLLPVNDPFMKEALGHG